MMMQPIVDAGWLGEHAGEAVLADVRWYLDGRSGREGYLEAHLPSARFVDLDRWLAGPPSDRAGRHPLPEPSVFAAGMRHLGIGDDDAVVAYDDDGGVIAARLVWMLRVTGHEAALLDGGMGAWTGELETGEPAPWPRSSYRARPWPPDRLADIDDASHPTNLVIDARNSDRYRGAHEPMDPRPGHIPGARNLPCRSNLNPDSTFLPVDGLREQFAALGVTEESEVISYCGSGVTACHNLLALEFAGLGRGRLYAGSWSQYSRQLERPAAVDEKV